MKHRRVKVFIMQDGVPAVEEYVEVSKRTREIRIQLAPEKIHTLSVGSIKSVERA